MGVKQRNTFLLDDGKGGQNGGVVERAKMQRHAMICDPICITTEWRRKKGCTETAAALSVPDEFITASQLTTVANGANVDVTCNFPPGAGWEIVSKGI